MEITDNRIDGGRAFDWGRVSGDYAVYRDIYPDVFYKKIIDRGLCVKGQSVLDAGTGTGVLPRHLYGYGAKWTGTDISEEQIKQAKKLSAGMDIDYQTVPAEKLCFPKETFDVITACQCFFYFDHEKVMPIFSDILKPDGRLLILYMAWLPFEDPIALESERIVLNYNPEWSGAGETRKPIPIPDISYKYFEFTDHEEYDVKVPFTRESWHGRMRACRGVGASLASRDLSHWESEHWNMLQDKAPDRFEVLHYFALAVLKKK